MPVFIACLVLFLAMTGHSSATYCLCKDGVSDQQMQKNIDYACGAGANCNQILQNGACYNPNTLKDHCHYAVNSYFQAKSQATGSCDFAGTATTSTTLPSNVVSTCAYPSSPGSTGSPANTPGGSTPTNSNSSTTLTPSSSSTSTPSYSGLGPSGTTTTINPDNSGGNGVIITHHGLLASLAATIVLPGLIFSRV